MNNHAIPLRTFEAMIRSCQAHETLIDCVRLLNLHGHHLSAELLLLNVDRVADKAKDAAAPADEPALLREQAA